MKKVVFTGIFFLVLGMAWMLYLDYNDRRFIENFRKPSPTVTHSVHTSKTSVMPESSETITSATFPLKIESETESENEAPDMFTERADVHPHTAENPQTEKTDFPASVFENELQNPDDSLPRWSTKKFLMEELGISEAEIERRIPHIKELNRLIWAKPENWVKGHPDEVGFVFETYTLEDTNTVRLSLGLPPLSPDLPEKKQVEKEQEIQLPHPSTFRTDE